MENRKESYYGHSKENRSVDGNGGKTSKESSGGPRHEERFLDPEVRVRKTDRGWGS
jgi:hypothetical protein